MDTLTVLLAVAIASTVGLVGMGLYWSNRRALERMTQESLNYRAELRAGLSSGPTRQEEPDLVSTLMTLAAQNPELVQKLVASLGGQGNTSDQVQGLLPGQKQQ